MVNSGPDRVVSLPAYFDEKEIKGYCEMIDNGKSPETNLTVERRYTNGYSVVVVISDVIKIRGISTVSVSIEVLCNGETVGIERFRKDENQEPKEYRRDLGEPKEYRRDLGIYGIYDVPSIRDGNTIYRVSLDVLDTTM